MTNTTVLVNNKLFCSFFRKSRVLSTYKSKTFFTLYDIGVGFGDFFECITFPPTTKLVLVDFVKKNLEIAATRLSKIYPKIETVLADLRTWEGRYHKADIVLCINVLPYITNYNQFLFLLSDLVKKNGHCCLVYPIKSPVWDERFDGIQITLFDPNNVNILASKAGLHVVEQTEIRFALPGTRGKIHFPIAMFTIFQREI